MLLKVFAILDLKAEAFMSPFFMSTTGQAMRAFKDLVNNPESSLYRHPADYRLHCIGAFDDSRGQLLPLDQVEPLGFASEFKDLSGTPIGVSGDPGMMPPTPISRRAL